MFTKVDSFYSFPLTGIIPLEFKLLKSSSLGYLKGSPPPTESGVSLADPGCTGTHASLKWEGASSCCPRECSSGSGLGLGLSLPPAPLQFIPGSTKGNLEKGEGEAGGHCLGGWGGQGGRGEENPEMSLTARESKGDATVSVPWGRDCPFPRVPGC